MRYNELFEDLDDDELFGKSRNQIIAQGLYTEAAKERDVAAEERGLGDLRNSHDFAKQAAETEALAREFEISLHNGMRAWRSIKNGFRRSDFADIVEYHTELNLYDIDKMVSEDADDDDMFAAGTRERIIQHIGNYIDEMEADLSQTMHPDEREWLVDEITSVSELFELAKRDISAAMDQLVSDSESHGWAGSLLASLEEAGINIGNVYTTPWMNENAEDDELFSTKTRKTADYQYQIIDDVSDMVARAVESYGDPIDSVGRYMDEYGYTMNEINRALNTAGYKDIYDMYQQFRDSLNEDADDDELFGETTLLKRIEQLLSAKQKVFTRVPGAMGQVMSLNGDNLILKTRPHSTTRYSWGGLENNPDRFKLERNPADGRWYLVDAQNPFNYRG